MTQKTSTELARERLTSIPSKVVGLRGLRRPDNGDLMEPCENCKCRRYNTCTCMRKGEKP